MVSGGPHNVQFWPTAFRPGRLRRSAVACPTRRARSRVRSCRSECDLYGCVTNTPAGEQVHCLPHMANKMFNKAIVTQ
jgi:hypothetical protein